MVRITLDALAVLDSIDRYGSFASAAEALHRVPSAVTYAVQKLEEDLDILIFDRSGHRAQLTEPGRELLKEGRRLLQAADELVARTKRVASGYEVELRIAVDSLIPVERLFPLIDQFYRQSCGTRIKLLTEVYGGMWDALVTQRADLAIGAPGEGPPGGGYSTRPLGLVQWAFMVAPDHPLATAPEPIPPEVIMPYRSIAAADSSRSLPPRTSGLLSGQDVLTVPEMQAKIACQRAGLGVGYLPLHLTRQDVIDGKLVIKKVVEVRNGTPLFLAWPTQHRGEAMAWLLNRFDEANWRENLLA
jgi:DNA-binding transcriptional LysR family regulator